MNLVSFAYSQIIIHELRFNLSQHENCREDRFLFHEIADGFRLQKRNRTKSRINGETPKNIYTKF